MSPLFWFLVNFIKYSPTIIISLRLFLGANSFPPKISPRNKWWGKERSLLSFSRYYFLSQENNHRAAANFFIRIKKLAERSGMAFSLTS